MFRRRHRQGNTTRPEDERYPPGQLLAYGTQHILTMYGGVIAPPLIVGGAAGLSPSDLGLLVTAGLVVSGLATLLQTLAIAAAAGKADFSVVGGADPDMASTTVAPLVGTFPCSASRSRSPWGSSRSRPRPSGTRARSGSA